MRSDLLEHTERSLRTEVERWLAAPDAETNFRSARDQREPGTGQWLVDSETYLQWKTGIIRHLWFHGKAGCGKSVISASIVEDVRRFSPDSAGTGCAIFYFAFSDSSKQSHIDCLRSIVHQLSGCPSVLSSLEQLFKTSEARREGGSRVDESHESLQNILVDRIRSHKRFFLILDGLDESPEMDGKNTRQREKLLEWLEILSAKLPMLQILATSRRLPDIEAALTGMKFHLESMITGCVNVDISKYVVNQLNKDRRLRELDANMKEKIQDAFMMKADGM